MPWVRKGRTVYKKLPHGRLEKKQTCKSVENAKAAIRLLYAKSKD